MRPRTRLSLLLAALPLLAPPARGDDITESREAVGIAEEQELLGKQLDRLRRTMETLLDNTEAEGRATTRELLEKGLALLAERSGSEGTSAELTLDELMGRSRTRLERGQVVQSLEDQQALVSRLESLLSVLQDRRDVEKLESNIDEIRALRREMGALRDQEAQLRDATEELRATAGGKEQARLESELARLATEQRQLLNRTEADGRRSGTLELERLEQALRALLRDQEVDAEVLEAWRPDEGALLEAAVESVSEASAAGARARRLSEAAAELRAAAGALNAEREDGAELAAGLDESAERADRHARAADDETAARVAEALEEAARAARTASRDEAAAGTSAARMQQLADELEAGADVEREAARGAAEQARRPLRKLEDDETAAGSVARAVEEALEEADRASEAGSDTAAARATESAAHELESGIGEMRMLGEVLSGSQASQSSKAESAARSLRTLAPEGDESAARTGEALERAAEAMREASAAARGGRAEESAEAAREGAEALREALEALSPTRSAAAARSEEGTQALAEAQARLEQESGALGEKPSHSALSPEARETVAGAMRAAREAMQRAREALEEGSSASAASSQRDALEALQQAGDLAAEQQRIERELLALATRAEERESGGAPEALERAANSARSATGALQEGDLERATEQEREVERALDEADEQLAQEEDRYQRLRQEELLFRIAEELDTLLTRHSEQMAATREVHAARDGAERPSRGQRLRLRRIAREEASIAERAGELAEAIRTEGSLVFAEVLAQARQDLERVARDLDEAGGYRTGDHVQSLQQDVLTSCEWLLEALRAEQQRRNEDEQQGEQQQDESEEGEEGENRLVPDAAELKLLRRMELEIRDGIEELRIAYPELASGEELDPLVLEEIQRLAIRHERSSDLFEAFRERVGFGARPDAEEGEPQADEEGEGE
jgi:hypothetical protein